MRIMSPTSKRYERIPRKTPPCQADDALIDIETHVGTSDHIRESAAAHVQHEALQAIRLSQPSRRPLRSS